MEFIRFVIDFILNIDVHLAELVAQYGIWVYAILFLILFCETGLVVTPFLPGDSLLFVAGALASLPSNDLNVHTMVTLMVIAAILGDAINYTIGRIFGEKLFSNPDSKIFRRSYLDKTHQSTRSMAVKRLFWRGLSRSFARLPHSWPVWGKCLIATLLPIT